MDERIYYSLLAAVLALQCQFSTFIEDRHNQLQNVYDYGNQRQQFLQQDDSESDFTENMDDDGNQTQPIVQQEDSESDFTENMDDDGNQTQPIVLQDDSDLVEDVDDDGNQTQPILPQENSDFARLTELEQRSIELEEDLRRATLQALSSRHGMQYGIRFLTLQRRLQRLRADLRTEMEPLNHWSSLQHHEQAFLRHEMKQMSSPFRVRSLPNILNSSELIDVDFEMIKEAQSFNRTILFKKDSLEDLHETFRIRLEELENMLENQRQAHGTMNPTQRERLPPRPTQHLHQPVFSVMDLTWTGTQRQTLPLPQPAPPTVNPTQTERQPPRAHPRAHPSRRVRQPSDTAVCSSSAQLENQSRRSTRTLTRVAASSNSSPPSSWNSISTAMCKMLVVICTAVLPFI